VVGLGAGVVLTGPLLLGAEILLATRGEPSPPLPADIDACVGCGTTGPPLRTVWLGDSTAAGVGVAEAGEVVGRQVARRLGGPVDVRVLATSGARVTDVVEEQLPQVPEDAQVICVSIGANDATHLTSASTFSSSYRRLVEGLPASACLVLLGVPDMGSTPRLAQPLRAVAGWRARTLDQKVRSLARAAGATYVDIAGTTGPAFRRDRSLFSVDGYHPGGTGYALWAGAVTAAMAADGLPGTPPSGTDRSCGP
jgi:lysophospholipase L1-like esterase